MRGNRFVEPGSQATRSRCNRVSVEHLRLRSVLVKAVNLEESGKRVVRFDKELQAISPLTECAEIVTYAVDGVVDPIAASLILER